MGFKPRLDMERFLMGLEGRLEGGTWPAKYFVKQVRKGKAKDAFFVLMKQLSHQGLVLTGDEAREARRYLVALGLPPLEVDALANAAALESGRQICVAIAECPARTMISLDIDFVYELNQEPGAEKLVPGCRWDAREAYLARTRLPHLLKLGAWERFAAALPRDAFALLGTLRRIGRRDPGNRVKVELYGHAGEPLDLRANSIAWRRSN